MQTYQERLTLAAVQIQSASVNLTEQGELIAKALVQGGVPATTFAVMKRRVSELQKALEDVDSLIRQYRDA